MKLTNKNYYSQKANAQYLSVSQYKLFCGTLGKIPCEEHALKVLKGEAEIERTIAMLVGSYVDSYFEGTLENFKENTPELFNSKTGTLKADYKQADEIIKRIEADKKFMQYMSGDKQVIMTAELFGVKWKIKMDSYLQGKAIVDLKVVEDIYKSFYHKDTGKLNFIQEFGYDFQLAIYQKVVELNTGKQLPCFIAAADKGKVTNIELIQIPQVNLDSALIGTQLGVDRIQQIKSGEVQPQRCGRCNYCKQTKVITKPISMSDLLKE